MKTEYIGAFQVPDGFFSDSAIVHLCFDPQTNYCLEVCATGCFRSCVPPATTKEEAEWLMQNHPVCKGRFKAATKQCEMHKEVQNEKTVQNAKTQRGRWNPCIMQKTGVLGAALPGHGILDGSALDMVQDARDYKTARNVVCATGIERG